MHQIDAAYTQIEDFAGMMIQLMRNSIPSAGTLDQATIDATIRNFESIQAGQALIGSKASFISYLNQVDAFVCVSKLVYDDLMTPIIKNTSKYYIVYNGIDPKSGKATRIKIEREGKTVKRIAKKSGEEIK